MWSARFLSHVNHVSVSPTDGNGPTQGQRKTLTRVGIEPTTFGLDLRRSTDWATRSDGSRPWELKMLKSRQWTCTSTREGYVYTNVGRVALFAKVCINVIVLVHVHCRDFNIFSSHGLLPSDLVAQSVERRRSNPKVVGSIPTLVRVFLCPCVGPFPSVGLTLTWFIWNRNPALPHYTLFS